MQESAETLEPMATLDAVKAKPRTARMRIEALSQLRLCTYKAINFQFKRIVKLLTHLVCSMYLTSILETGPTAQSAQTPLSPRLLAVQIGSDSASLNLYNYNWDNSRWQWWATTVTNVTIV